MSPIQQQSMSSIPAYILGGSGFAAGELARLLHGHSEIDLAGVLSNSQGGQRLGILHPHLAPVYPDMETTSWDDLASLDVAHDRIAVFSALPHGYSASRIKHFLDVTNADQQYVVDLSADFRFDTTAQFEHVYNIAHGAPEFIDDFYSGIPELSVNTPPSRISHPGCFSTAVVLAATPLSQAGCLDKIRVSAVTGSTGSGREPKPTTHHPVRANNFYAYKPLEHRHRFEMQGLIERSTGTRHEVSFVPHSGPFARGIHATLFSDNKKELSSTDVMDVLRDYYSDKPFVQIVDHPPKLKNVVGTNFCHLNAHADSDTIVVFSVIDNLLKGASGGGLQWMNRILGLDETMGLQAPGLGWL